MTRVVLSHNSKTSARSNAEPLSLAAMSANPRQAPMNRFDSLAPARLALRAACCSLPEPPPCASVVLGVPATGQRVLRIYSEGRQMSL